MLLRELLHKQGFPLNLTEELLLEWNCREWSGWIVTFCGEQCPFSLYMFWHRVLSQLKGLFQNDVVSEQFQNHVSEQYSLCLFNSCCLHVLIYLSGTVSFHWQRYYYSANLHLCEIVGGVFFDESLTWGDDIDVMLIVLRLYMQLTFLGLINGIKKVVNGEDLQT